MIGALAASGIHVPPGFATTAAAFRGYLDANGLNETITATLARLDQGRTTLASARHASRSAIIDGSFFEATRAAIVSAYRELSARTGGGEVAVAVWSSATAEDLPDASFAGQQETFLNVRGEAALLESCRRCYASVFTDRAITYRQLKGFDHRKVALSAGVQQMVRADIGSAGVMFSVDTGSGFDKVVLMNAAWGLGENVVQGTVSSDEYADGVRRGQRRQGASSCADPVRHAGGPRRPGRHRGADPRLRRQGLLSHRPAGAVAVAHRRLLPP